MIFGGFRGIRPDTSWQTGLIAVCGAVELVSLLGYLGGYFDREPGGSLQWHAFEWDAQTIAYTVALWLAWALGVVVARYYKTPEHRWGTRALLSLPIAAFLFMALGLVQLGPPQ